MSTKKKKKGASSLYIFPVLLIVICVSYLVRFLFFNIETDIVKYDTIEKAVPVQALIIRNENVTSLPAGVQLNYKANDGERVAFGKKILEVVKNGGADENISIKIKELNARIEEIKKSDANNNFFPQDKERIESSIAAKAMEIKQLSKTGDVEKLEDSKESLQADLYKKSLVYGEGSFTGQNLEQLTKEKNDLEALYKNNLDAIYAQNTGVVSYELDGYEQSLSPANIKNLNIKSVKEIVDAIDSKKSDKNKTTGVKVVDNFEWYVSSIMKAEDASDLKEGKSVKLRFDDMGEAVADGVVMSVSAPEQDEVLVNIRISENIKDFYKYRLVKADIIKNDYEGFLVPSKCLIDKGNTKGVYVLRSGTVRFIPVVILTANEDDVLVRNLNEDEQGETSTPLLKVFDEVVVSTKMVKENQIITDSI